ncbi:MAG: hypothetical protein ACE5JU_03635 [Candidatus Binatia bacterium]
MRKIALLITLPAFLLLELYGSIESSGTGNLYAQSFKEKTLNVDGSTITVRVIPKEAKVVKVKPYIKAKKGKKRGRLWLDVVIKNMGNKPQRYSVFGQGRTKSGGWLGGSLKRFPKKGKLGPGEETTAKVKTRYKGKAIPKEIRVEIFPPL